MTGKDAGPRGDSETARTRRQLSPAARRALDEAARRRARNDTDGRHRPKEVAGRDGPEPTRYGDWEKNGIASDF